MAGLPRSQSTLNHICMSMWKLSVVCYELNNHFHHAPPPSCVFVCACVREAVKAGQQVALQLFVLSELSVVLKVNLPDLLLLQKRRMGEEESE